MNPIDRGDIAIPLLLSFVPQNENTKLPFNLCFAVFLNSILLVDRSRCINRATDHQSVNAMEGGVAEILFIVAIVSGVPWGTKEGWDVL